MRYIKGIVAALAIILILLLVWGTLIEPHLIDRREEIAAIPDLPPAWEGRRIAVVADFQVGMWLANTGTARRAVDEIVKERPSAALIAGDFLYHPNPDVRGNIETVMDILRPLAESGIPTYAVFESHDYAMGATEPLTEKDEEIAQALRSALQDAGIEVLQNEARQVPLPDDAGADGSEVPLYLVGVGSRGAGNSNPEAALAGVPADAPRVVLMHNPEIFGELPASTAPLAIAGHTHGGQIRIPLTENWSYLTLVQPGEIHADGWIEDSYGAPGNQLYVNRGIGFSKIPVRINAMPELTVFTLQRGNPEQPADRG